MVLARPAPAAVRRAAVHNGDRVSRAEIAWAIPPGSRRARSQRQFLRAAMAWPELAGVRGDFRRNLEEFLRILARRASWATMTTWRPRRLACLDGAFSASTYKRCRAWWQAAGFLGVVREGRTAIGRGRPAALDEDRNEAKVYVLAIPRKHAKRTEPASATPVTGPPTTSRSEVDPAHTRASRATTEKRTPLRGDSSAKPAVPRAIADDPVLKKLSDRARACFWRPFEAAAWSAADFLHAVNCRPDGPHRRPLGDVIYPAGWLRWRLAWWLGPDGVPVASRSQRRAAAAAAVRAGQAAAAAERDRLAAAAVPANTAIEQLRAERGWKRRAH